MAAPDLFGDIPIVAPAQGAPAAAAPQAAPSLQRSSPSAPAQEPYAAATPQQQQFLAANGATYDRSKLSPGVVFDTADRKAGDDTTHVTTGGVLVTPGVDADHNLFADIPMVSAGYNRAYAEQQASSDPGVEGMSDAWLNGLTFNNADRVKGALATVGPALRYLAGDHSVSPGDAYAAERDLTRTEEADFAAKHPWLNALSVIGGGAPLAEAAGALIAGPSRMAATGLSAVTDGAVQGATAQAGGAFARGVGTNAALGAAYGAGANKEDPLRGANDGADLGAALGVIAPAAGGVVRGVANSSRAVINQARDALTPAGSPQALSKAQQIAAEYLGGKLQAAGVTSADIAANPAAARGATVAEALGPDAVSDVAAIVRRPGASAQAARDVVGPASDRVLGRTDRLLADVHGATGVDPNTAQAGVEGIVAAGQDAAGPHYDALRADTNRYMTPTMRQVIEQTPAGQAALAATHRDLLNAVPAGGPAPSDMGIVAGPDGQLTVPGGLRPAAIDMVKRNLDAATKFNPMGGADNSNANSAVDAARDAYVTSARQVVPNYDPALSNAADYKKVESAFKATKGIVFSGGRSVQDTQNLVDGVGSPHELQAVRARAAADLMDKADNGTLTPGSFKANGVKSKLDIIFGPGTADKVAAAAAQEGSLTGSANKITSGSITAEAIAHAADQDNTLDSLRAGMHVVHRLKEGKFISAATAGLTHAFESSGKAMAAPQAQAVRDAIGSLYLSPARDFGTFTPPKTPAATAALRYLTGVGQLGPAVLPNASALRPPASADH